MNRFQVMPCIPQEEINGEGEGLVLPLASEIENNCVLFFPVSNDIGKLINYLLESEEVEEQQIHMIEVFRTMIDTWRSGERFLSGIFIDANYDENSQEDIINVNIMLSDTADGYVQAVIKVNFIHAIVISVMEDVEIMISNELLNKLLPESFADEDYDGDNDDFDDEISDSDSFPVDENIIEIAKKIMGGKIK